MIRQKPTWRAYQTRLKQQRLLRGRVRRYSLISLAALVLAGGLAAWLAVSCGHRDAGRTTETRPAARPAVMSKTQVRTLLGDRQLFNLSADRFPLERDGRRFLVQTSLNIPLQQYLLDQLDRKNSRTIAVVLMEPGTGRLLTLAGYNRPDPRRNPCLESRHPAASVFKIVTAAAAVETCDFTAQTRLAYNGRKYTLYKSQLTQRRNQYTRTISLKESFAQSINPVFGKIGTHHLQQSALARYAERFGFNAPLDTELPLAPSVVALTDDPYQWAEVASGFNRQTRISPLHGAVLAATVVNDGERVAPSAVERIFDADGNAVYRAGRQSVQQTIAPATAAVMRDLMRATVRTGTCRKVFRHYRRDPVLKGLDIGGKTGSIGTDDPEVRYDWFVGFAADRSGTELAAAVMVMHEKYIGIRAGQYARMAFKEYFSRYAGRKATQT